MPEIKGMNLRSKIRVFVAGGGLPVTGSDDDSEASFRFEKRSRPNEDELDFQSSTTGFDWVSSDMPPLKPMITLRNAPPEWRQATFENSRMSGPVFKAMYFQDGAVTVSTPAIPENNAVSVYGPTMEAVKAWWNRQTLGSPPAPIIPALKYTDFSCVRPRFTSLVELFGGSAAYSAVWDRGDRNVTVCEVQKMHTMWETVTKTNWAEEFAKLEEMIESGEVMPGQGFDVFPDKNLRLVMEKMLIIASPSFEASEGKGGAKIAARGLERFEKKECRDMMLKSLQAMARWTVCDGFQEGIRLVLERTQPCAVIIDPPYEGFDGDKYSYRITRDEFQKLAQGCIDMARQGNQLILSESVRTSIPKWYHGVIAQLNEENITWISKSYSAARQNHGSFCEIVIVINPDMTKCTPKGWRTNNPQIFSPRAVPALPKHTPLSSVYVISHYGQKNRFAKHAAIKYKKVMNNQNQYKAWMDPDFVQKAIRTT